MTVIDATAAPVSGIAPRILAGWYATRRADLGSHVSVHGPIPDLASVKRHSPERLLDAVRSAGLTGRGGAGFPSARKWDVVRGCRNPIVVVNAMEGEPASEKDRALLCGAPHLVLDGAQLAAAAVGAREVLVCVGEDSPDGARSIELALTERVVAGIGGVTVEMVQPPGRYLSGEESALVNWIGGGYARPTFRRDKATALAVRRRAVLVHNCETLAHVALIARYGPEWFRSVGTPDAPGTTLVTASGAIDRPGVYEVELGSPVLSILEVAGLSNVVSGVLVGGFGGTWLHPDLLETPYAPGPLSVAGSAMGAGVLAALPASSCGVAETARIALYMAGESAGQCGPCVYGLPAIAQDLAELARGSGSRSNLTRLRHRLNAVVGRGACRHPDGVVRLVRSALGVFAADFAEHARRRPCEGSRRRPVLRVPRSAPDGAGNVALGRRTR